MISLNLSIKEAEFLVALLECGSSNRQTALQLLAADHLYEPSLLPKLRQFAKEMKKANAVVNSNATVAT